MCYISRYLKSHTIWSQPFFLASNLTKPTNLSFTHIPQHTIHWPANVPHTATPTCFHSYCPSACLKCSLIISNNKTHPYLRSYLNTTSSTVFSFLSFKLMLTPFVPHMSYILFTGLHSSVGYKLLGVRSHHILPFLPKDTQTNIWFPASVPTKSALPFVSSKWQTWEAS